MKYNRVNKVLIEMEKCNLEQILVSSPHSIFYLTGEWIRSGERMLALLIKKNGDHKLFVNRLFPINNGIDLDIVWYEDNENPIDILSRYVEKNKTLGIDKDWPSRFLINLMDKGLVDNYVNSSGIIDRLRMIKDEEEIELMKIASKKNDNVMRNLWSEFKEGMTEKYYENILRELYESEGIMDFSFTPIVAFSPNGSDPHHSIGKTKLKKGNSIVIDIGGIYKSYCSDMTRTIFFGEDPNESDKEIYNIVKEANFKGIEAVKPGAKFSEVDLACRQYIDEHGYGKYFTHRTGHSIGLETHDFGDVSSSNNNELMEGMIFSIEPGIYLPNRIGVRIEDLVLVTNKGVEVLNDVTKDIVVIN